MSRWRDMESAPRNGNDVLIRIEGRPPVVAGWFQGGWTMFDGAKPVSGRVTAWAPLPGDNPHRERAMAPADYEVEF
ncbi:MAG: hypothetical protein AAFU68_02835 [Pseudomonadota bacterium]